MREATSGGGTWKAPKDLHAYMHWLAARIHPPTVVSKESAAMCHVPCVV